MADKIVSIRMPVTLLDELRVLADKNHFLDVSEELRSLLRDKWMEHKDPYSQRLTAISRQAKKSQVPEKIKTLKKDLNKLLEEINELN